MKRLLNISLLFILIVGLLLGGSTAVLATSPSDQPIVVYGETLTAEQKEEVRNLLEVTDESDVKEFVVTGADIAKYINGDPNSNMYSSAKIILEPAGKGITVHIVTADNITEVTTDMYKNALLTAGVEDATVEVASPIPVTGGSALSGIYKAYDEEGEELDQGRMEVASEELDVATELSDREGLDQDKVTELLAEIKKAISEQKPATKEDIEKIITEQLDKLEISLSEKDRELLTNLFEKMRNLNIDFDKVKGQLDDLVSTIKGKVGDLEIDEGFWNKVINVIKNFFDSIVSLLEGMFGGGSD